MDKNSQTKLSSLLNLNWWQFMEFMKLTREEIVDEYSRQTDMFCCYALCRVLANGGKFGVMTTCIKYWSGHMRLKQPMEWFLWQYDLGQILCAYCTNQMTKEERKKKTILILNNKIIILNCTKQRMQPKIVNLFKMFINFSINLSTCLYQSLLFTYHQILEHSYSEDLYLL